jgi:hypothetical protein
MRVTHFGHACVLVELDLPVTAPAPARRDLRDRGPRIVRHLDGTLRLYETTLERLETIFPGPGGTRAGSVRMVAASADRRQEVS